MKERITQARQRILMVSLRGCKCPACGKHKGRSMSMCQKCYYALPADQQRALYRRIGEGYEEALTAAFVTLGKSKFLV